MMDIKSLGVNVILPRLLMETLEQANITLARVVNMSLEQGVIPFERKVPNIMTLFKKIRELSKIITYLWV